MSHDYAGEKFFRGGNQLLLEAISNHAKNIGKSLVGTCVYPKARVECYGDFMPSRNCYEIAVEWIDPFDNSRLLPKLHSYTMLESEFREFTEPIYRITKFKDISKYPLDCSDSFVHESVLEDLMKSDNDEIKVSFQSKKLVANKVNNSKEIENFLLIN